MPISGVFCAKADLLAQHIVELEQDDRRDHGEDDGQDEILLHGRSLAGGRREDPAATKDD
jgi:hypothetical protein